MKRHIKTTAPETDPATAQLRARARQAGIEVIDALLHLARDAESESVQLAAIKELLDRGYGRAAAAPTESAGGITAHLLVDDGYAN